MQNEVSSFPLTIGLKGDLCIDDLQEEVFIALGEHLQFCLTRRLREETVPFPSDGQYEIGCQLVGANVSI